MRKIPNFPDYKITKNGEVFSNRRSYRKPKKLRWYLDSKGYPYVKLVDREGVQRRPSVHRLVLATFNRSKRPGEVCRHLDGDSLNNHLNNLCWGTQKQNMDDSDRHGNRPRGVRNGRAKLTEEDVRIIRGLTISISEIARQYGVDRKAIRSLLERKTWKHVL